MAPIYGLLISVCVAGFFAHQVVRKSQEKWKLVVAVGVAGFALGVTAMALWVLATWPRVRFSERVIPASSAPPPATGG